MRLLIQSLIKEKCLGYIYIDQSKSINYDCEVFFWIRDDSTELKIYFI